VWQDWGPHPRSCWVWRTSFRDYVSVHILISLCRVPWTYFEMQVWCLRCGTWSHTTHIGTRLVARGAHRTVTVYGRKHSVTGWCRVHHYHYRRAIHKPTTVQSVQNMAVFSGLQGKKMLSIEHEYWDLSGGQRRHEHRAADHRRSELVWVSEPPSGDGALKKGSITRTMDAHLLNSTTHSPCMISLSSAPWRPTLHCSSSWMCDGHFSESWWKRAHTMNLLLQLCSHNSLRLSSIPHFTCGVVYAVTGFSNQLWMRITAVKHLWDTRKPTWPHRQSETKIMSEEGIEWIGIGMYCHCPLFALCSQYLQ